MSAMAVAAADRIMLLLLAGEDCREAINAALRHAKSTSQRLQVIQILSSSLYHYGHQDLVATRPSKKQFLLYIREDVLRRGQAEIEALEEMAGKTGILLDVKTIESEDPVSAALSEANKGYGLVFLPKQKKRRFPLFERTLAEHLKRKIPGKIIPC
jgi:hypothetical protein